MKRIVDMVVAGAGLIVTAPVWGGVAAAIRLVDGPPVLFVQERLGRDREVFRVVKFRTMRDGEVTAVGRVLRALGLDEIPQLINVLRGEMSLIGPRPLTGEDVERLGWSDSQFDGRWSVRPGITGMAQLSHRCDPDLSIRLDLFYAEHASVWLDAAVAVGTLASPVLRFLRRIHERTFSQAGGGRRS